MNLHTSPGWLHYVPRAAVPYIQLSRLHYFAGPNLLFWPCAWGLTLGAILNDGVSTSALAKQLCMYYFGSLLLHSVGSTWNDICDKDLDAQVARTKNRPLVRGSVTVRNACIFLMPQVFALVKMLRLTNDLAFLIGLFGLFFWVPIYPLMKRITYWPQAWLGIAGNIGLLVGYASITNSIDSPAWMLFIGSWCWCMHYDTVYGMMDKKDDVAAGIKSTALLFGSHTRLIISFFALGFVMALIAVGLTLNFSLAYYLAVAATSAHLAWQLITVDFESQQSCMRVFASNTKQLGYLVWGGLFYEYSAGFVMDAVDFIYTFAIGGYPALWNVVVDARGSV